MRSALMDDKRYLAVRLTSAVTFDEGRLKNELTRSLSVVLGVMGMSEMEPSLISFDAKNNEFVLRAKRGYERKLVSALALVNSLGNQPAHLECLRISGTIKRLRMKRGEDKQVE